MDDSALDNDTPPHTPVPWDSMGQDEGPVEAGIGETEPDLQEDVLNVPTHGQEAEDHVPAEEAGFPASTGGGWTLPLLCGGIALIACCALIPQADANRRLAYERRMLEADLQTVEKQISVNIEFLKKVGQDPTLAERLAQRQMKVIPQGSRVLELSQDGSGGMSPFQLVNVAPPLAPPPYKPIGGVIARVCYDSHARLYLIGAALGMIATGLVLGSAPPK